MRRLLLAAIAAYQRYLSPYKGFRCAYRAHTGRASCSALGFRVVRRYGVVAGLALLRRRFERCGESHRRHAGPRKYLPHAQAGFLDAGCDLPCDLHGADGASCAGDILGACGDVRGCGGSSDGGDQRGDRDSKKRHGL
jgi:putative component of membrane protein insertase Oxa1/YidC/SpoIIIJ protein YidD